MSQRPTPEDWFRVLWAARAVLADFEMDDSTVDVEETASEIELRESIRVIAEYVGIPAPMLELDPEHPDLPFNPNLSGDA
jgi:hypothetical protein